MIARQLGTTNSRPANGRYQLEVNHRRGCTYRAGPVLGIGRPDDVAGMVLFLASESAAWITGQICQVNGGYSFAA
jgi:NAD(P)-dependent dehydrogenase (short-subunit alcohol dehydrogenase family)